MIFNQQTLTGDVIVDGNTFVECHFKDARLIYRAADSFAFVGRNTFERVMPIVLDAAAAAYSFMEAMKNVAPLPDKGKPAKRKVSKRRKH